MLARAQVSPEEMKNNFLSKGCNIRPSVLIFTSVRSVESNLFEKSGYLEKFIFYYVSHMKEFYQSPKTRIKFYFIAALMPTEND